MLLAALLAGCAAPTPRPVPQVVDDQYHARAAELEAWPGWALRGRLGLSQGEEGGSGRLDWTQQGDAAELNFRGTLGRGAWRLVTSSDGARLELANGETRAAPEVETLVFDATGWSVPVTALRWWVRGLAWPGEAGPTQWALNEDGTPSTLSQAGWTVDFSRYTEGPGALPLPTRLRAEKDGLVVKLAVSRWTREDAEPDLGAAVENPRDG